VLEIGCGIGTDAVEFIQNKAKYYGIDYSDKSIQICNKRIEVLKLQKFNPTFLVDNCENLKQFKKLKVHKQGIDLIYSFGVIHHTPNMKNCFDSIYQIASKKTLIKIMLYAKNSYKNFLVNKTPYRYEAQKGCPVVHTVSDTDINLLCKNKFKIISKKQDFIFPYKIKPYKNGKYEKIKHFKYMPDIIFNILKKNIGEHLLLTLKKI
jgi:ubiquinone/menaquinone biosynthesis C-methylase UbiE